MSMEKRYEKFASQYNGPDFNTLDEVDYFVILLFSHK